MVIRRVEPTGVVVGAKSDMEVVATLAYDVVDAFDDDRGNLGWRADQERRLREQWPALWRAVRALRLAIYEQRSAVDKAQEEAQQARIRAQREAAADAAKAAADAAKARTAAPRKSRRASGATS